MNNFILILVFLFAGYLAKKSGKLPAQASQWLNHYVIWICLPAVVLARVPNLETDWTLLYVVLIAWLSVILGVVFSLLIGRWLKLSRSTVGCMMMVSGFGNTSFFGLPMLLALLGPEAIPTAVFYDQIGSFLSLAILGNIILAHYATALSDERSHGAGSQAPSQRKLTAGQKNLKILFRVLTFPPFVSLLLATAFGNAWLGERATQILEMIGASLTPVTMFLVGVHLQFRLAQADRKPLAYVLSVKLLFIPMIAAGLLLGFGQTGLPAQVILLESAMPPMVTASVMAIHAGLAPRLAASAVGYGLFVSLITLPIWRWLSDVII